MGILWLGCPLQTTAQVVFDGSMGSAEQPEGPNYEIEAEQGQQQGSNLFHSFSDFNLAQGESATFNGPGSVNNIITRVTGGNISNINGTLRSTIPDANFYLINPAGVIFGTHASLDIGGSFHVSTADYLLMEDQTRFYATPQNDEILTSVPPSAFGFLDNTVGDITFKGSGSESVETSDSLNGITVNEGKTISIIGGDIQIQRGFVDDTVLVESRIQAPEGRINVVSVASSGEAALTESGVDVRNFETMGEITLEGISTESTSVLQVSGEAGGDIYIRGGKFTVKNAQVNSTGTGNEKGGGIIDIQLTGNLALTDSGAIISQSEGEGDGSDMTIHAENIGVSKGGYIRNYAYGSGNGGDTTISADEAIVISSNKEHLFGSDNGEKGGNLSINASRLKLKDGAWINYFNSGNDEATEVNVEVDELEIFDGKIQTMYGESSKGGILSVSASESVLISGGSLIASGFSAGVMAKIEVTSPKVTIMEKGGILGTPLNFNSSSEAQQGADISLNVNTLEIIGSETSDSDYSEIKSAGLFGKDNGGNISITASEKILIDGSQGLAQIVSGSQEGNGGNINISTPSLILQGNAEIVSSTRGGDAGDIDVNAHEIDITGGNINSSVGWVDINNTTGDAEYEFNGNGGNVKLNATGSIQISGNTEGNAKERISAIQTVNRGAGDSGSVNISTPTLSIGEGGLISSVAEGSGNAGNLQITADDIEITEGGYLSASTLRNGNSGDINIQATNSIRISKTGFLTGYGNENNSGLFSTTSGSGNAANISVETPILNLGEGGVIGVSVDHTEAQGKGGNVLLNVDSLEIKEGGTINAGTQGLGDAGTITLNTTNTVLENGGQITTESSGSGHAGSLSLSATDSLIITGQNDLKNSGLFSTASGTGDAGSITTDAPLTVISDHGQINTSSSGSGTGGNIIMEGATLRVENEGKINSDSSSSDINAGEAGTIAITTTEQVLMDHGVIATESANAGGGSITVHTNELLHLKDSEITTTVRGGGGDAGNIDIDPKFVILDGSRIIANAFEGKGGNIRIVADHFIQSPDSIVQASSQLGIDGSVEIDSPVVDFTGSLEVLPTSFLDASQLIKERCSVRSAEDMSSFVIVGRDGIPPSPDDLHAGTFTEVHGLSYTAAFRKPFPLPFVFRNEKGSVLFPLTGCPQ